MLQHEQPKKDEKKSSKKQAKQSNEQNPRSSDEQSNHQSDEQQDRQRDNAQSKNDERKGAQSEQQKQPNEQRLDDARNGRGSQQQNGTANQDKGEERGTEHTQTPLNQSSSQNHSTPAKARQLDPAMQNILQQAAEMEKEGQRHYVQVLAGQNQSAAKDVYAW
jgi:hypothetical protein